MNTRIKLHVVGITFSQIQAGAYALIMAEEGGPRRILIIIGTPEAQSIAIYLEKLHPPRPLTHDLFISLLKSINCQLKEVNIFKFEDGIYYSKMTFIQNNQTFIIDSRSSDAIALAIRIDAPVYTTEEIMKEAGIVIGDDATDSLNEDQGRRRESSYELMDHEELKEALNEAIAFEQYEKASHIRDILKKKV